MTVTVTLTLTRAHSLRILDSHGFSFAKKRSSPTPTVRVAGLRIGRFIQKEEGDDDPRWIP